MSFLNYAEAKAKFTGELMTGSIDLLEEFDEFHCLLKGNMSTALQVQSEIGPLPKLYCDWLKLCDGGLLFTTVMLSSRAYNEELDLEFDTYSEYNSDQAKSEYSLPEGYSIFAVRNYGDPICFNVKENDGKVYLWNPEMQDFEDIWDTFEDWLAEEVDTGIELIAEEALDPLMIKLGGDEDE